MAIDNYLQQLSLFKHLPQNDLAILEKIVRVRSYKRDEHIFYENDEAKVFFGLVQGRVKIYKLGFTGKEHILHILRPGEIFAEVAVFWDLKYPANALAMEKSKVLLIPKQDFKELLQKSPELSLHFLGIFALRLKEMVSKVEELSLKEVPARLATYFILAWETEGKKEFVLDVSKHQLAGLLGTIPETLSRVIKKFKEQELIEIEQNRMKLHNVERLKKIAQGIERI